jgi:malonyl-CoA/methylmalonyl-CoA synthetase
MSNHLFDAIRAAARHDEVFIEIASGDTWTYRQVLDLSGRLANAIRKLGVVRGDRVAVQVEKSPEALMLYLACVRCGAVYLPLNTAYTLAELDYFIGDAEPRLVVVTPASREAMEKMTGFRGVVQTLDAQGEGWLKALAAGEHASFEDEPCGADDLAAILYTSGTTGRSKGAMLTHGNLLSNAATLCDYWRVTAADRLIHALPIFHTHGLFVATNVMLLAGASMFLLPKFDAEEVLSLMPRSTMLMGVPTFYTRLLQTARLDAKVTSPMRLFVSGSAPLLADTHNEFRRRTGHAILERYGMTETNMNTSNPYDGERVAGTVGFPLPGIGVRVTDPATGVVLPTGETGMIEIKGPNVFKGYWRMPEKTAAEFTADGFFVSGDLGTIDQRGYVRIVGRAKDLVISGGYNIYPKEVEGEIDQLEGVGESAVIGVPHPDFGEGVTAVVVRKPGVAIDEATVLAALAQRLARYKQPKRVIFVEDLPRNAMGKVQKNVLRERYGGIYKS